MGAESSPLVGVPDNLPDEFALLRVMLARIPDHRHRQGKLYALPDVLSLVVLGLMANCRSLSAISRFGKCHREVLPALGLRDVPSVPTLSRILSGVDADAVRAALQRFAAAVVQHRGASLGVVAMDGKTLRGVHEGAAPLHLLHLFAQQSAVVLDQVSVGRGNAEMTEAKARIRTWPVCFRD